MTAYLVTSIEVHDSETYAIYHEKAVGVLESFRRKSFAVTGLDQAPVVYESETPGRIGVMAFKSMEDIDAFYTSPEYQEALKYRQAAATTHFLVAMPGQDARPV